VLAACLSVGASAGVVQAADSDGFAVVCRFDAELREVSGLAASTQHSGVLWLHEDSGNGPTLYAIDSTSCATVATLTVRGAAARDFEAIGIGKMPDGAPAIWLGDVGDNLDSWRYVEVLRIREPAKLRDASVRAKTFRFTYEDEPHNAEALLVFGSQLWVVTKQLANGALYRLPNPLNPRRVNIATRVQTETGLVTDGSVAPDGSRYILRDYFDAQLFTGLPPGTPGETIALPAQVQGEAITFSADGRSLFVASERDRRLFRMELRASASTSNPDEPSDDAAADPSSTVEDAPSPVPSVPWSVVALAAVAVLAVFAFAELRRRRSGQ
jgi:hypothetical protein